MSSFCHHKVSLKLSELVCVHMCALEVHLSETCLVVFKFEVDKLPLVQKRKLMGNGEFNYLSVCFLSDH
jgi:hypothetical protein